MGSTDLSNSCTRGSAAFKRELGGEAGLALCAVGWQGRRCQGVTDAAWVRVGLKARESLHSQRAQLMLSCRPSSSLEDKQGSDSELHLKERLGNFKFNYLNLCPVFVLAPKPTPVLTAVRHRETFICPAEM